MSKNNKHVGVHLLQKVKGGNWYCKFNDARDGNKQRKPSAETDNYKEAEYLAIQLSRILKSGDDVPDGLDDRVYKMARVLPYSKRLALAEAAGIPGAENISGGPLSDKKDLPPSMKVLPDEILQALEGHGQRNLEAEKALKELIRDFPLMRKDRDHWRARALFAEGQMLEKGQRNVIQQGKKPLSLAIAEYMKDGCPAKTKHWRKNVNNCLDNLQEYLGDINVHDVKPEQIIAHAKDKKEKKPTLENKSLTNVVRVLSAFLKWITRDRFDRLTVTEWTKINLPFDEQDAWFWMTPEEVRATVAEIAKTSQYYADCVLLQYGCAFRAEEMPLIQKSHVTITGDKATISLAVIVGQSPRRLKNRRSADAVNVPSWALDALRRRMAAVTKTGRLFPKADNELWLAAGERCEFSEAYCPIIRAGAKAVLAADRYCDEKDFNKKVNSKTMRHTAGRELILKYGFDKAAAVLRHSDVATLRSHYADLLTSDVSTER